MGHRLRLPKYVHAFTDIRGKRRYYLRRRGHKKIPLPELNSPEFALAYEAALAGQRPIPIGSHRTVPGTVGDLVARYFAEARFQSLSPLTQQAYRSILERFRAQHGDKRVALLEREHINRMLAKKIATPTAANHWLRMIRALMKFAVLEGMRPDDPTVGVNYVPYASAGVHTWSEDDIAAFEAKHPIGSKARLAFALMLYTGCRRADAAVLGRQHIKNGFLTYTQNKNRKRKPVTLTIPVVPELHAVIDATPSGHLTFIVNRSGQPYTPHGFGIWMKQCCREAGLPECTSHGLRKAISRRLAEAGKSSHEIMSVTGHTTLKEVERYTRAASQKLLAQRALAGEGPNGEQGVANIPNTLANAGEKLSKSKGGN
jgi:integrase